MIYLFLGTIIYVVTTKITYELTINYILIKNNIIYYISQSGDNIFEELELIYN